MASMAAPFVSPLCQQIALAALRSGEETAAKIRDEFAGRRRYLVESLQGMELPPAYPAGGFFCWAPVGRWGLTGREFARKLLLSQRVLVNAGEPFGPSGEDFIRLSYATEEGRLREGLQRLATFMEELRKSHAETPPRLDWNGSRPSGEPVLDEHVQQSPFGPAI
jgi:aspartate/methionine/tyrosine aminotransferase